MAARGGHCYKNVRAGQCQCFRHEMTCWAVFERMLERGCERCAQVLEKLNNVSCGQRCVVGSGGKSVGEGLACHLFQNEKWHVS